MASAGSSRNAENPQNNAEKSHNIAGELHKDAGKAYNSPAKTLYNRLSALNEVTDSRENSLERKHQEIGFIDEFAPAQSELSDSDQSETSESSVFVSAPQTPQRIDLKNDRERRESHDENGHRFNASNLESNEPTQKSNLNSNPKSTEPTEENEHQTPEKRKSPYRSKPPSARNEENDNDSPRAPLLSEIPLEDASNPDKIQPQNNPEKIQPQDNPEKIQSQNNPVSEKDVDNFFGKGQGDEASCSMENSPGPHRGETYSNASTEERDEADHRRHRPAYLKIPPRIYGFGGEGGGGRREDGEKVEIVVSAPEEDQEPPKEEPPKVQVREPSTICCHCLVRPPFSKWCGCGIFYRDTELDECYNVFQWYDLVLAVLGTVLYVANFCTDLWLAGTFVLTGHPNFGALTLALVLLAYVVNVITSFCKLWHYCKSSCLLWIPMFIAILLNLGPVVITCLYVHHGMKSRQNELAISVRRDYVEKMTRRNADTCCIRLFGGCLQAAPQLLFQLFILITTKPHLEGPEEAFRALTLLTSWFCLALAVAALRDELFLEEVYRTSFQHVLLDFLWRLSVTGGRVLCVAFFASLFRWWVFAILVPHALIMSLCYYIKNRRRRHWFVSNMLLSLLVGFFSVFSFIQLFYDEDLDDDFGEEDEEDGGNSDHNIEVHEDDQISSDFEILGGDSVPNIIDPLAQHHPHNQLLQLPASAIPPSKHSTLTSIGKRSTHSSAAGKHSTLSSMAGKTSTLSSTLGGRSSMYRHHRKGSVGFKSSPHKRQRRADNNDHDDDDTPSVDEYFYHHYYKVRFGSVLMYGLFYVENFTMLILWYVLSPDKGLWYHHWGLVACLVALPFHALFKRLYRCPELGRKVSKRDKENLYLITADAFGGSRPAINHPPFDGDTADEDEADRELRKLNTD